MVKHESKKNQRKKDKSKLEHPEQQFVDDIPDEELKLQMEDEKNKKKSKDSSSSERE